MRKAATFCLILMIVATDTRASWGQGSCGPGGCSPSPGFSPSRPVRPAPVIASGSNGYYNRQVQPNTVTAASVKVRAGSAGGSGTCICNDGKYCYILTCKHVISRDVPVTVYFPRDGARQGRFLQADPSADLALIVIAADKALPVVPIAEVAPRPGEATWLVGYPKGVGPRELRGGILGNMGRSWRIDQRSISGDSGGGIFREDGYLCGVLWGGTGSDGLAVPLADVRRFTQQCFGIGNRRPSEPIIINNPAPNIPGTTIVQVPSVPQDRPAAPAPVQLPDTRIELVLTQMQGLTAQMQELMSRPQVPGPAGEPGQPGPAGRPGEPGANGEPGPAGKAGPAGRDGLNGKDGTNGRDGRDADTTAIQAELDALKARLDQQQQILQSLSGSFRIQVAPK